jgi:hypothetical protein
MDPPYPRVRRQVVSGELRNQRAGGDGLVVEYHEPTK